MCDKVFVPTGPGNKYCGDKTDNNSCAKKRHLQKRRETRYSKATKYTRICKNCPVEFTTTNPDKVYCGSRQAKTGCSFLFRAGKEYKQDLSLPKICLGCQIPFYAKTPTRLYCGNREEKTGCAYQNELKWSQKKRDAFTPHQKEIQAKYKLNRKLLTKYGLLPEDYENKLIEQNYCCAICKKPAEESTFHRKLYIDHNHDTNQVRGLLCSGCNSGLGMFLESVENMELAINYIKKWNN